MLLAMLFGVVGRCPLEFSAPSGTRSRWLARLLRLNSPWPLVPGPVLLGGEVVVSEGDFGVLSRDGVRSFHAAIILRTDVKGERGDVCGR